MFDFQIFSVFFYFIYHICIFFYKIYISLTLVLMANTTITLYISTCINCVLHSLRLHCHVQLVNERLTSPLNSKRKCALKLDIYYWIHWMGWGLNILATLCIVSDRILQYAMENNTYSKSYISLKWQFTEILNMLHR